MAFHTTNATDYTLPHTFVITFHTIDTVTLAMSTLTPELSGLLPIIRGEFSKLRIPSSSDRVHKDECMFSFDRYLLLLNHEVIKLH